MKTLISLVFLFQLKHFLADFPFQTDWLKTKNDKLKWLIPMTAHAIVHGLGSCLIVVMLYTYFTPMVFPWTLCALVAAFDFGSHMVIDIVKSRLSLLVTDKYQGWLLGADQFAHHTANLLMIVYIVGWLVVSGMIINNG